MTVFFLAVTVRVLAAAKAVDSSLVVKPMVHPLLSNEIVAKAKQQPRPK